MMTDDKIGTRMRWSVVGFFPFVHFWSHTAMIVIQGIDGQGYWLVRDLQN